MARTHTRVSMSRVSTVERSFTACAIVARTEAERTSYCCAPARACSDANASSRTAAARSARHVRPGMLELRLQVSRGLRERHAGCGLLAAVLVFDHAFLEATLADHEAMRDAH